MAGHPSKTKSLDVWMNGELVGRWDHSSTTVHSFRYDVSWLHNPRGRPLSLSLPWPNETRPFTGKLVENYFDNLLPDSPTIRSRLAARFGVNASSAFELLGAIGRDCVGAVQLLPAGTPAPDVKRIDATRLTTADIEKLIDDTMSGKRIEGPDEDGLRIALPGDHEKIALLQHLGRWCRPNGATPATHLLKIPSAARGEQRADPFNLIENEWLCAKIAQAYGLPVADCRMETFGRHKTLVVERFDRRKLDTWCVRLPQEDFCQVKGLSSAQKYEEKGGPGIDDILDTLRGSENAKVDRTNFLATQLLFWLLAAPGGHAKNFSIFLEPEGRFRMTPLYDITSNWAMPGFNNSLPFQKLAMAIRAKKPLYQVAEIQRTHWNVVAKKNAMGIDFEEIIQRFIDTTPSVLHNVAMQLPEGFPEDIHLPIIEGIRRQVSVLSQGN